MCKIAASEARLASSKRPDSRMAAIVEDRYLAMLDKADHGGHCQSGSSGSG